MKGLGERQHVSLGRVVKGHARSSLESGRGCDVEDAAAPSLNHSREQQASEVRQSVDIELEHLQLAVEGQFDKKALCPEAGVIDQDIYFPAGGLHQVK